MQRKIRNPVTRKSWSLVPIVADLVRKAEITALSTLGKTLLNRVFIFVDGQMFLFSLLQDILLAYNLLQI